ncbi:MAG: hypothetical protein ACJAUQ_000256 [Maribacter sp.]|jgi:hypothetical protein
MNSEESSRCFDPLKTRTQINLIHCIIDIYKYIFNIYFIPLGVGFKTHTYVRQNEHYFYPKKPEVNSNGMVRLYTRITLNVKQSEFSLERPVNEQRWTSTSAKLRGYSIEVVNFNRFLDKVKSRLFEIYENCLKERLDISATIVKNIFLGKDGKEYSVLEIFQEHNDVIECLLGRGFTKGAL